jgi:hypothetical protein
MRSQLRTQTAADNDIVELESVRVAAAADWAGKVRLRRALAQEG